MVTQKKHNKVLIANFIVFSFIFLFTLNFISAFGFDNQQSIGSYQQGSVNIIQTCSNCNYNNITSIFFPQGNQFILQQETSMTKSGTLYNYTFPEINLTGQYVVTGHGDQNGTDTPWTLTFNVGSTMSWQVYLIILGIALFIMILGFTIKEAGVTLFGAMALAYLAIFTFNNGISTFRNPLTDGFALFLTGISLIVGLECIRELLDV